MTSKVKRNQSESKKSFFKNPQLNSLSSEKSKAGYIQTLGNTLQVSPWHLHSEQLTTDIHNSVVEKLAKDSTCTWLSILECVGFGFFFF